MPLFKRQLPNAIIAAATEMRLNAPDDARRARSRYQAWQREAWDRYDEVGEIKEAINWFANTLSKLNLIIARVEDPTRKPVILSKEEAPKEWEALNRLKRPYGSHAALLREAFVNWNVAGECYLLGSNRNGQRESWDIKSIEEIEPASDGRWQVREEDTTDPPRILNPAQDFLLRLWVRHPRRSVLADSPLHGVLDPAEEVLLLSKDSRATLRQRLNAGILTLPSELSFGAEDSTEESKPAAHRFIEKLMQAVMTPISDEGSAASVIPTFMLGPAEFLKEVRHITLGRPIDEHHDAKMERALRRLAIGLPLPVEVILGMAGLNHWTSWKIDDDAFNHYMEPIADALVDALTMGYLWPALGIEDFTEQTPIIWYDTTRVVSRPDKTEDWKDAHERGEASGAAYREGLGIPEAYAPSEEELLKRMVMERGSLDPFMTEALLKRFFPDIVVIRPSGQTGKEVGVSPKAPVEDKPSIPTETAPRTPQGANTVSTDTVAASVYYKVLGASDSACRRSLEKAGARLRSHVQTKHKDMVTVIASARNIKVAAILGPDQVEKVGMTDQQLIEGSFAELKEQVFTWFRREGFEDHYIHPVWQNLSSRLFTICRHALFDPPNDFEPLIAPAVKASLEELVACAPVA